MKTIINTFRAIVLIACIMAFSFSENYAGQTRLYKRYNATGFSIGSKGYLGLGYGYSGTTYTSYLKDFWEYNPATDSWTQKADFGGAGRENAVGFSIGTKGYIGTGLIYSSGQSTLLKDFWEYNPSTNKWTQKADFAGNARWGATGFSINNLGFIGTGRGGVDPISNLNIHLKDFWEYNPGVGTGGTWTQRTDFPGDARYSSVGFGIGNMGYVGTGIYFINSSMITFYKDFYQYDPATYAWIKKADFGGLARAFAVGYSIGNLGYIGTGETVGFVLSNDFWEYNPAIDTWVQKTNFGGTARTNAAGFSIGTKGYIGTGYLSSSNYFQDFWEFTQSTNTWAQKADFGSRRKGNAKDLESGESPMTTEEILTVYPNPSNSSFNFKLMSGSTDLVNIKILDLFGRVVREFQALPGGDGMITIGDNLNAGIYIVVVTQGDLKKSVKIVKRF